MRGIAREIAFVGIMLVPCCAAAAANDCRVIEYADHVEAVCTGDPRGIPGKSGAAAETRASNGAQVSRIRRDLEKIRDMNAHRFDVTGAKGTTGTLPGNDRKGY